MCKPLIKHDLAFSTKHHNTSIEVHKFRHKINHRFRTGLAPRWRVKSIPKISHPVTRIAPWQNELCDTFCCRAELKRCLALCQPRPIASGVAKVAGLAQIILLPAARFRIFTNGKRCRSGRDLHLSCSTLSGDPAPDCLATNGLLLPHGSGPLAVASETNRSG